MPSDARKFTLKSSGTMNGAKQLPQVTSRLLIVFPLPSNQPVISSVSVTTMSSLVEHYNAELAMATPENSGNDSIRMAQSTAHARILSKTENTFLDVISEPPCRPYLLRELAILILRRSHCIRAPPKHLGSQHSLTPLVDLGGLPQMQIRGDSRETLCTPLGNASKIFHIPIQTRIPQRDRHWPEPQCYHGVSASDKTVIDFQTSPGQNPSVTTGFWLLLI